MPRDIGQAFFEVGFAEFAVTSGGDIMPEHKLLSEGLAALQAGA